ncbi:AAA family ATPase [Planktomarina temperata]|nr:AAA family ATPase [Planktomarina temperata]
MDIPAADKKLSNLGTFNLLLGKNGSGKSTILRNLDNALTGKGKVVYVAPERGGILSYNGHLETLRQNDHGYRRERRKNQYAAYKEASVSEFKNLEILVLRHIERDAETRANNAITFDTEIQKLNRLLDRVELRRSSNAAFTIFLKGTERATPPENLSSGEAELISLGIEVLSFAYACRSDQYSATDNWLLLDEPDSHLHPDLQRRFTELLVSAFEGIAAMAIIATHSTCIVSSLIDQPNARVAHVTREDANIKLREVSDSLKAILPVFGAHPLSQVFNQSPPLIVEGEDDERIWQTVVRSSQGRVRLFPCVAGTLAKMTEYETTSNDVMSSIYDNAKCFSLRDGDDGPYEIEDLGQVTRFRLNCRNAENLLVSDGVLASLKTNWDALQAKIELWINSNEGHVRYGNMVAFRDGGWDRKFHQLKEIRLVLVDLAGSNKPWEVIVGRAIASLSADSPANEHSLKDYLGEKLVREVLGLV